MIKVLINTLQRVIRFWLNIKTTNPLCKTALFLVELCYNTFYAFEGIFMLSLLYILIIYRWLIISLWTIWWYHVLWLVLISRFWSDTIFWIYKGFCFGFSAVKWIRLAEEMSFQINVSTWSYSVSPSSWNAKWLRIDKMEKFRLFCSPPHVQSSLSSIAWLASILNQEFCLSL